MYLDSAYVAKYYVNERDARAVRNLIRRAAHVCSSSWAIVEVTAVFHRHVREGSLTISQGRELIDVFRSHVEADLWNLISVTDALLQKTANLIRGLASNVALRAGDAIHLATAIEAGETEIWTNDRHLLSAAAYVGLTGKSVIQ
ncbi:MAG: type II toxin-antitoxin system VapC family toxin [Acidobacteriaceae bacterium]|nr:type II toxin-antitoxin system VapC family toxin [Acidobacteriaceae bacterium]